MHIDPAPIESLTWRETTVLQLLGARLSNEEIAAVLHTSSGIIKRRTSSIYQKLVIRTRRGGHHPAKKYQRVSTALVAARDGLCSGRESRSMSTTPQRAREALDRQGIPRANTGAHGYRVSKGPGTSATVRWGHGRPFCTVRGTRNDDGLASCNGALTREGFQTSLEQLADPSSLHIVVTDRL